MKRSCISFGVTHNESHPDAEHNPLSPSPAVTSSSRVALLDSDRSLQSLCSDPSAAWLAGETRGKISESPLVQERSGRSRKRSDRKGQSCQCDDDEAFKQREAMLGDLNVMGIV